MEANSEGYYPASSQAPTEPEAETEVPVPPIMAHLHGACKHAAEKIGVPDWPASS